MIECRLSTLMGAQRKKISEVSRAAGISRTTLIGLYYDRSKAVSFRVVELLCRYLNCTIGDLFVIEEENHGKM